MKEPIYVFDKHDNLLAVISDYIEAPFDETVEGAVSFEVVLPIDHEEAHHLVGGNQVAFGDLDGRFRLFTIRETDDEDGETTEKRVFCLPAIEELSDYIVEERVPQNRTAEYTVALVLQGTRWLLGNIADLGLNSTSFYYETVLECLRKIIEVWGGELVDRIEIANGKIAGRYVDIVYRRGADTGKRFEIDKDIHSIVRTVLYYPKTALYGRGASLEIEDEEGNHTGGYTRLIDFADVEWKTANGDPVNKPLGQKWVGDDTARLKHGIPNGANMQHRTGIFTDGEEEDPATLLAKTWHALQSEKEPKAQYEMSVVTFEGMAGYEHERVRLGDTGAAIDKNVKPEILIEARVMRLKYDIGDPSNGELIIGNFLELDDTDDKIDWLVEKVNSGMGAWNKSAAPITDDRFPDITPPAPAGAKAVGLFQSIAVSWNYDPLGYIAAYEVYASRVDNFVPDATNLVYKGKTGGYVHKVNVDEQWYFRVRSINMHGTPSTFSAQLRANTISIASNDLGEDVVDTLHIKDGAITNAKIHDLSADKILTGTLTAIDIEAVTIESSVFRTINEYGDVFEITPYRLRQRYYDLGPDTPYREIQISSGEFRMDTVKKDSAGNFYLQSRTVMEDGQLKVAAGSGTLNPGERHIVLFSWYNKSNPNIKEGNNTAIQVRKGNNVNLEISNSVVDNWGYIESYNGDGIFIRSHDKLYFKSTSKLTLNATAGIDIFGNLSSFTVDGAVDFKRGSTEIGYFGISSADNMLIQSENRDLLLQTTGNGAIRLSGNINTFTINDGGGINYNHGSVQYGYVGRETGGSFLINSFNRRLWFVAQGDLTLQPSGIVNTTANIRKSTNGDFRIEATNGYMAVGSQNDVVYLQTGAAEAKVTNWLSSTSYKPIRASGFPTGSMAEYKQDIVEWKNSSALETIRKATIYEYRLITEVEQGIDRVRQGLVIGEGYNTPVQFIDGDGVEQYLLNMWNMKAIQELDCKFINFEKNTKDEIARLKKRVKELEEKTT